LSTREQSPTEHGTRSRSSWPATSGRPVRLIALLAATITTTIIWLIAHALGVDFTLRASGKSTTVDLPAVIGFTLGIAAIGWAALAVLERYTRRAATIWTRVAGGVFVLSLIPIFAEQAAAGTRTTLVLMHVSVAAILVPLLRRSARATTSDAASVQPHRQP
jgi:hypothetical protein